MPMKIKLLLTFVLTLWLTGCVIAVNDDNFATSDSWQERIEHNKQIINTLAPGRTLQSVMNDMGQPDISEAVVRDNKTLRILYYRTQRVRSDYKTTKDEATPLVFIDDQLIGWGDAALRMQGLI